MRRIIQVVGAIVLAIGLSGCGYNQIQSADEATKSAWSEVINQYQRRADLDRKSTRLNSSHRL